MSYTLVDLKHAKVLGPISEGFATLCHATDGFDPSGFSADAKALTTLEIARRARADARFQEELRGRVGQGTVDAMRALVEAQPVLPAAFGLSKEARQALVTSLVGSLHSPLVGQDVARVVGGELEAHVLANLEAPKRRAIIAALLPALHDAEGWTSGCRPQLPQGAEAVQAALQLLSPADAVELEEGTALADTIVHAAGLAVGLEAIHHLLASAPIEQLYGLLEEVLVNAQPHLARALFYSEVRPAPEDGEAREGILQLRALALAGKDLLVAVVRGNPTHAWEVDLIAGRRMAIKDWITSDPYCVLTLDDPATQLSERRTVVKRNTTNPRWDVSFWFASTRQARLRIEVLDHDRFSADDPMGWWSIAGTELPVGEAVDDWYVLLDVSRGQLRVRITLRALATADTP